MNWVRMKDTEGESLPGGRRCWHVSANMCRNKDNDIKIVLSIPMVFQTYDRNGDEDELYNGAGVIHASLRDIFEAYLLDHESDDGGESLIFFSRLLKEYSEKYSVASLSCDYQLVLPLCNQGENNER